MRRLGGRHEHEPSFVPTGYTKPATFVGNFSQPATRVSKKVHHEQGASFEFTNTLLNDHCGQTHFIVVKPILDYRVGNLLQYMNNYDSLLLPA